MTDVDDSVLGTDQGTETTPEGNSSGRARSLANLRPPFRKGETGNPRGINGRGKNKAVVAFLEAFEEGADRPRIDEVLQAAYRAAVIDREAAAQRLLVEQYAGRARVSTEELTLHMAEHFRAIARDQFDILVKMLGDRLKTMSVDEMAELLAKCDRNPRRFLAAAFHEITGQPPSETPEVPQTEPAEPAPPTQPPELPEAPPSTDPSPVGWLEGDEGGDL